MTIHEYTTKSVPLYLLFCRDFLLLLLIEKTPKYKDPV